MAGSNKGEPPEVHPKDTPPGEETGGLENDYRNDEEKQWGNHRQRKNLCPDTAGEH